MISVCSNIIPSQSSIQIIQNALFEMSSTWCLLSPITKAYSLPICCSICFWIYPAMKQSHSNKEPVEHQKLCYANMSLHKLDPQNYTHRWKVEFFECGKKAQIKNLSDIFTTATENKIIWIRTPMSLSIHSICLILETHKEASHHEANLKIRQIQPESPYRHKYWIFATPCYLNSNRVVEIPTVKIFNVTIMLLPTVSFPDAFGKVQAHKVKNSQSCSSRYALGRKLESFFLILLPTLV